MPPDIKMVSGSHQFRSLEWCSREVKDRSMEASRTLIGSFCILKKAKIRIH